ncbi:hypothetical protein HOY82DRAFT_200374 [Tuber indicum]|nr:hypothetical protein HOY82DRAFT_200374 [Tuber indicum]
MLAKHLASIVINYMFAMFTCGRVSLQFRGRHTWPRFLRTKMFALRYWVMGVILVSSFLTPEGKFTGSRFSG